MKKLLALIIYIFITIPALAHPNDEKTMNRLDYIISYNFDEEKGGTIKTKNYGELKLDWKQLSEYANENKSDIKERLDKSIKEKIPVWLVFNPDNEFLAENGVWFAYKDVIKDVPDKGADRLRIWARLCPSSFYLSQNSADFDELYLKLKAAKGKSVYMAASPASEIYDVIIIDKTP